MPLLVNKVQMFDLNQIKSTNALYERYPKIMEHPRRYIFGLKVLLCDTERTPALYVMQHEYAIVSPYDEFIETIFTDYTTTCVTGILRNRRNRVICLCHFDRINLNQDLSTFDQICRRMSLSASSSIMDHDDEFDLTLIGGYLDEQNISDQLVIDILHMFNLIKFTIHLTFVYVGKLNTKMVRHYPNEDMTNNGSNKNNIVEIPEPDITGISVTVRNGDFHKAILYRKSSESMDTIRIPLYKLRRTFLLFHTSSMREYQSIYDYREQLMCIPPLKLDRCYFTASAKHYFEETLKFSDQEILNHFSTSPMTESEYFVDEMREIIEFLYDHICKFGYESEDLILSTYFPINQPRRFRLMKDTNPSKSNGALQQNNRQGTSIEPVVADPLNFEESEDDNFFENGIWYSWKEI